MDIRNLDQIQEQDSPRGAGLWPWLLAAASAGALVMTAVMSMPRKSEVALSSRDPLSELISQAKVAKPEPSDQLRTDDASFPKLLSDRERPSVAYVTVKSGNGRLIPASESEPDEVPEPPPAGDSLPVVPLPAGKLLESTRVTTEPSDDLTGLAADRAQVAAETEPAPAGSEGQYQIQVASFRKKADAEAYAAELRLRGHQAHTQAARVPNRGVWHRVRVGPFKHKYKALSYKAQFDEKEGMATFLVDPDKVERREAQRAAKLAARAKKAKRRRSSN